MHSSSFDQKLALDQFDSDGHSELSNACSTENYEKVCELIKQGSDVNKKLEKDELKGKTALMFASQKSNIDIVKLLIDHDAELNITDAFGNTALMYACETSNIEITRRLLDADADIKIANKFGNTALVIACQICDPQIIMLLLDAGADVNWQDKKGMTALMHACKNIAPDEIKILEILLSTKRVDKSLKDSKGKDCYEYISQNNLIPEDLKKKINDKLRNENESMNEILGKRPLELARVNNASKISKLDQFHYKETSFKSS